jgi:hypothetical protein
VKEENPAMFDFDQLNYDDYAYEASLDTAPYIDVNMNTSTDAEIQEAADAYYDSGTGSAVDYRNSVQSKIDKRRNARSRFEKDLMACMKTEDAGTPQAMGVVDLVNNTYVANKKANELFEQASLNQALYRRSGCEATGANCYRLFHALFVKEGGEGLSYTETESAVAYDEETITGPSSETCLLSNPAAEGTQRVWYAYTAITGGFTYAYAVYYDNIAERWNFAVATESESGPTIGEVLYTTEDVDADTIDWTEAESSSSSQE